MKAENIHLSRRAFLQGVAGALAASVLSACGKATPTVAPPATQAAEQKAPTATAAPTATPAPTAAAAVTLTFVTGEDPRAPIGEQFLFTEWQKATGIKIQWQPVPSSSLSEKVNLMLSANEAPDIFIGPRGTVLQYGAEACLPLDDLIQQHAPNYAALLQQYAADVKRLRAADGKIYIMCGRNNNVYFGWMYRKDLADKLGVTTLETLDDWYSYMKAVKEDDANTHGVGIYGDVLGLAQSLKGAFGIKGTSNDWWTQRDGQWVDGSLLPGAKESVALVAKWYQEGLVDPDMLATVEWEQNKEKWMADKSVVGVNDYLVGDAWELEYREQHPGSAFNIETAVPAVGPRGERAETGNATGFSWFGYALGKKCQDPAAAVKFLDFIFSEEGLVLYSLGVEGKTFKKTDGEYEFLPEAKELIEKTVKEGGMETTVALWKLYGIGFPFFSCKAYPAPQPYYSAHIGVTVSEEMAAAQALSAPYMEASVAAPTFTQEEQDELTQLNADLNTYRQETWVSMIKGDMGMDQWDTYVQQMKSMGADRVAEIWNTAAARG